jgi:hypothetical protein
MQKSFKWGQAHWSPAFPYYFSHDIDAIAFWVARTQVCPIRKGTIEPK